MIESFHPKVQNAGLAGSVTTVLLYILAQLNLVLPPEVAAAIVVITMTVAGYQTPPQ